MRKKLRIAQAQLFGALTPGGFTVALGARRIPRQRTFLHRPVQPKPPYFPCILITVLVYGGLTDLHVGLYQSCTQQNSQIPP